MGGTLKEQAARMSNYELKRAVVYYNDLLERSENSTDETGYNKYLSKIRALEFELRRRST